MKKSVLKILIALLLLINGSGAIYGGLSLVLHPDGSNIGLSLHWLALTSFTDYFIPGIILLVSNGLLSIFVLLMLALKSKRAAMLVIMQGAVLTGWLLIQVWLIRTIHFMHLLMGAIGLLLLLLGFVLHRVTKEGKHADKKRSGTTQN